MALSSPVFQYSSVYVKISEAKKLTSREMSGLRDPFCVLKIDNETVARTATAFKTLDPFWGEEYTFHVPNEFQDISAFVYDYDIVGAKEPLGKVMLERESIIKQPRGLDKWFPLTLISRDDDVQGEVLVEVCIEPNDAESYRVTLTVVEARDLAAKSDGNSDPFSSVVHNKVTYSTQVIQKTRFPRWKKTFEFMAPKPITEPANGMVVITVYNWDRLSQNQFMGQVELDLADFQLGQRYKTWYRLQHHEPKEHEKQKELGSLRLKVQCHEEKILESRFYAPFVQLMLKAVEDPMPEGSPLLQMLEEVMTMDRNAMGHTLVRFYLAHGSVLPLLDMLTIREIHQTADSHTLFRNNSLASKALDQFMKVVALPYLHETLKEAIDRIYTEHKVCELDTEKVKQINKARASGTSLAATQKVVEFTVLTLTNYLEQILDAIFSSVGRCPPLMRMALRQLWKRVRDRWPEEKYRDVPYLAVTGFLFLRFLVPAILAPKLFSIRDEHPDQKTERTLKLLSKVIQSMGNLQAEVDTKEAFMQPMVPLVTEGIVKVRRFIDQLLEVDQSVRSEVGLKDGGYIHHLVLCNGPLFKKSSSNASSTGMGHLQFRKRYFELSNQALSYSQSEKKAGQEVKSYPVQWIKVVEKLDEGAFHRKHMFQVVLVPNGPSARDLPSQITLYLQAADVNEQNQWVSAVRKACLTNRDMSPVYHPGAFKKTKWSCCRTTAGQEPGCSQCHRGITIGDWRDPLDPELDAQVIITQYQQARSVLVKKHLPGEEDGSSACGMRDGSSSPTSMTSCGATSLPEEGGSGATEAATSPRMELACKELIRVLDDLSYQHGQILASPS
ncbi:hypothetical protein EMCRGX_G024652 [Ephydatia muelleri]